MRGGRGVRILGGLAVLLCIALLLQLLGVFHFVGWSAPAPRSADQDAVRRLERELFEEMRRGAVLRGIPGIDTRQAGHGVVTGTIMLNVAGGGPRPLPGVQVQVLGLGETAVEPLPAVETDPEGVFTFVKVPAQAGYVLIVEHAPYRRIVLRGINVLKDRTTDVGTLLLGAPTSLSGRVLDARGRPIAAARVQVLRDESRADSFDARRAFFELQYAGSALAEAVAQSDGRFVIRDLPPGRYVLRVSAPGYATRFKSNVLVTVDEQSSAVRVILDAGAGFYGRVLDENGRGMADARVIAVALPGRKLNRLDKVEVRSAGDGSYRLDTLISGMSYGIEAWAKDYAPTGMLLLNVSGVTERDFRLTRTGRVEGRVTDEDTGEPVPEAQVTVVAGPLTGASPVATMTDETGHFVLPHVNPGPIRIVSCAAVGYQPGDKADMGGINGLAVVAGETTWLEWTLRGGGVVRGRVTADGGRPVAYATLALADRRKRRQRWTGEITGMSGADGRYELVGVRAGTYDLHVTAPGYAPLPDDETSRVDMDEALTTVEKDVRLLRGATLHGTIRAPDGGTVRGARVWLEAAAGGTARDRVRDLRAVSGANGGYRIQGAPPGVALVVAADHDAYVVARSAPQHLSAGQDRQVDVKLKGGARLSGRVEDVRGGAIEEARVRWGSIEGVAERELRDAFRADGYLGPRVLRTDTDGRFLLERLPPGRLLLKVEKEGYAPWYRRDLVIDGEADQQALTAVLVATAGIRGRVRAADTGRPLAAAFVYARERGPAEGEAQDPGRVQAVASAETAPDGTYLLEGLPPGVHEVVVWFAESYIGAAQNWRHPKVRRQGVATGSTGIDFELDPIVPPAADGG